MKKHIHVLCIASILIIAFLAGCGHLAAADSSDDKMLQVTEQIAFATETVPVDTDDAMLATFESDYQEADVMGLPTVDDETYLSEIQTAYSLAELTDFFGDYDNVNDYYYSDHAKHITLEQANEAFPIEVLRSGKYAVYRVTEGGYFFVFFHWKLLVADLDKYDPSDDPWGRWEEAPVYEADFCLYLDVLPGIELFSSIEPGVSTGQDVLNVDNRTVFGLFLSSYTYSHTLLSDGSILEIIYQDHDDLETENYYQTLTVDTMRVYHQSELSKVWRRDSNSITILVFVLPKDIKAVSQSSQNHQ